MNYSDLGESKDKRKSALPWGEEKSLRFLVSVRVASDLRIGIFNLKFVFLQYKC